MTSLIAWLDASSDEQRRMRDIIRLFSERDSRDELGLGQIRDGLSDMLFPGTSTLHTRARYLLLVPWVYQYASTRRDPVAEADRTERAVISAIRDTDDYAGLLGMQAGVALKNLPSTVYWSMLRHYGILADPTLSREDAARLHGRSADEPEINGTPGTVFRAWSSTIPDPPNGFPRVVEGGFTLRRDEADWLRERILDKASGSLLAHLAVHRPERDSWAPWVDDAALSAAGEARELLEQARYFSITMHGAQLLYNLLLAEEYEGAGFAKVADPAQEYRDRLTTWASEYVGVVAPEAGDLHQLISRIDRFRGAPMSLLTRRFVLEWADLIQTAGPEAIADDHVARRLVARREKQNKGGQARIGNPRRLQNWSGGSGAGALTYRWSTVRGILLDLHDGLERER